MKDGPEIEGYYIFKCALLQKGKKHASTWVQSEQTQADHSIRNEAIFS
jgi:hypothetical protein